MVVEIDIIQELTRIVVIGILEALSLFVFSFLVLPTWTGAINDVEHVNVQEQIKTLQSM